MNKALSAALRFLGLLLRRVAQMLQSVGNLFHRGAHLLYGFVPGLCSPSQLSEFVRAHYRTAYSKHGVHQLFEQEMPTLTPWEKEVLDHYRIASGRMLILGSGLGREAIAIAKRGVMAIGVDTNRIAVQVARQLAARNQAPAHFHQADFLKLPYTPASFDGALLSSLMYSAIPGTAQRQAWLVELGRLLKPGGLLMLSFCAEHASGSRVSALLRSLRDRLARLPGANPSYQPGDSYAGDHFLHVFQHEEEIRRELAAAGFCIRELDWARGYVVVTSASQGDGEASARSASTSGLHSHSFAAEGERKGVNKRIASLSVRRWGES